MGDLQPEKTADIWWRHHWFPRKMTSEKWWQKSHTDYLCNTTQIWVVLILRRHLAGKPVVVLQCVGYFLRLGGIFPEL